jgi:hypothetical protein
LGQFGGFQFGGFHVDFRLAGLPSTEAVFCQCGSRYIATAQESFDDGK